VHGDLLDHWDVSERYRSAEETQHVSASGSSQLTVRKVGVVAFPRSQSGAFVEWSEPWWCVLVAEGHEVGRDGVVVCLFEARRGKRSGDEEA
jgi:hypothetical protein